MKPKKLNFMNVKEEEILTREEMRNIIAGCGCDNCSDGVTCTATAKCYSWTGTVTGTVSCTSSNENGCSSGTESVTCTDCSGVSHTDYCSGGCS